MDIKEIRELIQAVCESGIAELELERTGVKVRIRKDNPLSQSVQVETTSSDESLPVQFIDRSSAQSVEKTSSISLSLETSQGKHISEDQVLAKASTFSLNLSF